MIEHLYNLSRPWLLKMDAEDAQALMTKALKFGNGVLLPSPVPNDPALESTLWGHKIPNPIGLAAGFDPNGSLIAPTFKMGFGFTEIGTVTPRPQHGAPKPRFFLCPEQEAAISRMGMPNAGMLAVKENLSAFLASGARPAGLIGINIGINKSQKDPAKDYGVLIKMLAPLVDYLAINIGAGAKTRESLLELLEGVKVEIRKACGEYPPPLLVKLSPINDEARVEELAKVFIEAGVDGIIISLPTPERPDGLPEKFAAIKGGLSGKPLAGKSTELIAKFYKLTNGKIPIIGVGGVSSGADAYEKIKAGASLLQLYTSLLYQGPGVVHKINRELLEFLQNQDNDNVSNVIGGTSYP